MRHILKIEAPYYEAIVEGRKNFEIRFNDRGYNAGDTVILQPLNNIGTYDSFKPCLAATIGYVTAYQQKEGWVVFSLLDVVKKTQSKGDE